MNTPYTKQLLKILIQVQLSLIIVGLFLALPFVVTNEYVPEGGIVGNFTDSTPPWVGTIEMEEAWIWTDNMLMLIMGGLPWQVYFQRKCSNFELQRTHFRIRP